VRYLTEWSPHVPPKRQLTVNDEHTGDYRGFEVLTTVVMKCAILPNGVHMFLLNVSWPSTD
jgi:hypothetical protein